MENLPDDLIYNISTFIKEGEERIKSRLINKTFKSSINIVSIKRLMIHEKLNWLIQDQTHRYKPIRNICINSGCLSKTMFYENELIETKCIGNIYLFQYNKQSYIKLKQEQQLDYPHTNYSWLYHDSRYQNRFERRQAALTRKLKDRVFRGQGNYSKIYLHYCPLCSAKHIIDKMPFYEYEIPSP